MPVADFSTSRPSAQQLLDAGYDSVIRYLAPLPNSKVITPWELSDYRTAGIAVGFVWETTAGRAGQGFTAGVFDATRADAMADSLRVPETVAIYYAVDFDAQPDAVMAYFRGVNSVSRRPVGGYGGFWVVESLFDAGLIRYGWQTLAWSGGRRSTRAHLYQRGSNLPGTDHNEVLKADWGQWSVVEEEDMTPEQDARLSLVLALLQGPLGVDRLSDIADWVKTTPDNIVGRLLAAQPDVDEAVLAKELAPLLTQNMTKLSDEDLKTFADTVATATANEFARRQEA